MATVVTVARNFFRRGFAAEMIRKIAGRLRPAAKDPATEGWYRSHAIDLAGWATRIDSTLWHEASAFADAHDAHAAPILDALPIRLGGAGNIALLYFLTRYLKPAEVLETGVAAGHSSRAFLDAMERNGGGRLVSSDFPYFRIADPERYVGIVVEPRLRHRWTLLTGGDRANLPIALATLSAIGLFHYDSDKSAHGRAFALDAVTPSLAGDAVILFDDVQDDDHFRRLVEGGGRGFAIFAQDGKMTGLICPDRSPLRPHVAGRTTGSTG